MVRQNSSKLKIGFIGTGTAGTALAVKLHTQGYHIAAASDTNPSSIQRFSAMLPGCKVYQKNQAVVDNANLIFITSPDDVIAPIAASLKWNNGQSVVHCSGAASLDILAPAREDGAVTGAMHPLQTFAGISQAIENIPGSTFAIEADEPLFSTLRDMAIAMGGTCIKLNPGDKVLYHAAAVLSCNYLVTLVKLATDLYKSFGIDPQQATQALMPLLQGTLNNIGSAGIPDCLTGPIARGDTGTIRKHIAAMEQSAPQALDAYLEMGLQTIPIALEKGKLDKNTADILKTLLKEKQNERNAERQNPSRAGH
ncbi:MAG: DUF2520 domain-containing protein [Dehalococcoidia bacterium]|jgi:predicted short-subunit dehydrogenase-like oxidoreductase (DUF2520 family)